MSTSNSPGAVATAVADRARGRGEGLTDLLPLMRAYYDFYGVSPADSDLLKMARGPSSTTPAVYSSGNG